MIEIEDVSFTYSTGERDAIPALRDLRLSIADESFVAVIGHNGSGKSTLARLLAALLFPDCGTIRIGGITSTHATRWRIRESVSIVFQDPDDQLVASRVIDDIAFGPENLGLPRNDIAERVNDAMKSLDLHSLRDTPIEDLSTAQKQLVAIAGALAMRPSVLVLDEPTSFLSRSAANRLIDRLRDIHRRFHTSIVYITHDMTEAARFDRVIVLDAGQIVFDERPSQLFVHEEPLRAIGLDVPLAAKVRNHLSAAGFTLPPVSTPGELRIALSRAVEALPAGDRRR